MPICYGWNAEIIFVMHGSASLRSVAARCQDPTNTQKRKQPVKQINIGIIGTGWCGGIRAETCAASPFVGDLHLAEINEPRLQEVAKKTASASATGDYKKLLAIKDIDAVIISATPETTHYPMAKESLLAGKHVFLEKPIALELAEADELIALARSKRRFFTIGYSQRFNPKFAYVKRSIDDGTIGAGWVLPPAYPNFSSTWIEMVGTEGAIMVDDTHRDVVLNTMQKGMVLPISTMPGEKVAQVYAGPMEAETIHFLECIALNRQPLVTAEHARMVMQVYRAADQSAEENRPIEVAV